MLLKSDDPPYFPVDTVVSARYRGAYCSAIVKRIVRLIKLRVEFNNPELGSCVISDSCIEGEAFIGKEINVEHPSRGTIHKATVTQIMDKSVYTVVYDDGDQSCMRRSKLRAPGERHFREFESLDLFPLLNPDQFGHPVSVSHINRQTVTVKQEPNAVSEIANPGPSSPPIASTSRGSPKKSAAQKVAAQSGRVNKRTKRKRKAKNARKKNQRIYTKRSQTSVTEAVVRNPETEEQVAIILAQASHNITRERIFYYYFTPEGNQTSERKKVFLQKRKAFSPKKVIKVVVVPSSATNQETAVPAESEDNSKNTAEPMDSVNGDAPEENNVSAEENIVVKIEVDDDEESMSAIDYSQRQLQSTEKLADTTVTEQLSNVERKQVPNPESSPTGPNHNGSNTW